MTTICRALEATVRSRLARLGVEDAVEVTVQLAHDEPRFDLQDAGPRAAGAQEGEDRLGPLPGQDGATAALAPAGRKAHLGQAVARARRPRRSARPARGARRGHRGSASRRPGNGRAARRSGSATAPRPSRWPDAGPSSPCSPIALARRRLGQPDREARHDRGACPASGRRAKASALRGTTAVSRRVDGGQLGAHGLYEVTVPSPGHDSPRGPQALRTVATGRPSVRASRRRMSASVSRRGSCRCAFAGSTTGARTTRGWEPPAGRSMRTGSAG